MAYLKDLIHEREENLRIESDPYDIQNGHYKRYKPEELLPEWNCSVY
jgi:hypothetical protein